MFKRMDRLNHVIMTQSAVPANDWQNIGLTLPYPDSNH